MAHIFGNLESIWAYFDHLRFPTALLINNGGIRTPHTHNRSQNNLLLSGLRQNMCPCAERKRKYEIVQYKNFFRKFGPNGNILVNFGPETWQLDKTWIGAGNVPSGFLI